MVATDRQSKAASNTASLFRTRIPMRLKDNSKLSPFTQYDKTGANSAAVATHHRTIAVIHPQPRRASSRSKARTTSNHTQPTRTTRTANRSTAQQTRTMRKRAIVA